MRRLLSFLLLIMLAQKAGSQVFYKKPSGQKYHLGDCRMVKNVSEAITASTAKNSDLNRVK